MITEAHKSGASTPQRIPALEPRDLAVSIRPGTSRGADAFPRRSAETSAAPRSGTGDEGFHLLLPEDEGRKRSIDLHSRFAHGFRVSRRFGHQKGAELLRGAGRRRHSVALEFVLGIRVAQSAYQLG